MKRNKKTPSNVTKENSIDCYSGTVLPVPRIADTKPFAFTPDVLFVLW